jgi:four helix bundle protein
MTVERTNLILEKSNEFAYEIICFCERLQANRQFHIANQLLRSGTSVGANVREAQHAESRADFIHKMKIAAKEAEEAEYWILLCNRSSAYPMSEELANEIRTIIKLLSKIIYTTRHNPQ